MSTNNIQIFRITGKKFGSDYVEYSLHKPIRYLQSEENKILVVNQPPFGYYNIGDYLGINAHTLYHLTNSYNSRVWSDHNVVSKVICRPPQFYTKEVFNIEEFGDGWVREVE